MIFENNITCEKCDELMNIIIFDKENETITYECECHEKKTLTFEEAKTEVTNDFFILNETGQMTYKCCCGCYCDGELDKHIEHNKEWLTPAYSGFCDTCYNKYELGIETCSWCGQEHEGTGEYTESDESFCSKQCYRESCEENEEEIDEAYLESIINDVQDGKKYQDLEL